jgi:predicted ATPase
MSSVLTIGKAEALSFMIRASRPNDPRLTYVLDLRPVGASYEIDCEKLYYEKPYLKDTVVLEAKKGQAKYRTNGTWLSPTWAFDPLESALSQSPKENITIETFRTALSSAVLYHLLDVSDRAPVRLPQPLQMTTSPGVNGEYLISCLYNLRETQRDRFEFLEDIMRVAFPGFERFEFPAVAAGTQVLGCRDKRFAQPVYAHQLSDGTLRFLWLATLLLSPDITAITMIDEPEISLHPELMSLLVQLMREASHHTQIFVATHSDRLVRFLKPEEVLVFDSQEDGGVTATWADTMDLDHWLDVYSLDEVWRMGQMGGRA